MTLRRYRAASACWLAAAVMAACGGGDPRPCRSQCAGFCGMEDGCGGVCDCPTGLLCGAGGLCKLPAACDDTCESAGVLCGEACGRFCGDCGLHQTCVAGTCTCSPLCDGGDCGDDGCGGRCACPEDALCDLRQQCVPALSCTATCADGALECGQVCGEPCGQCPAGESCSEGQQCLCAPDCDGSHCGPDGCGGTCPSPCGSEPRELSCADCSLRLRAIAAERDGLLARVQLAVEYLPGEVEPRPRAIDLRLRANAVVSLVAAAAGPALSAAGKGLWTDPDTGRPWRRLADGSFQILILSALSDATVGAGELLSLSFLTGVDGPVAFALVKRPETFAPPDADLALQATAYDGSVVVIVAATAGD